MKSTNWKLGAGLTRSAGLLAVGVLGCAIALDAVFDRATAEDPAIPAAGAATAAFSSDQKAGIEAIIKDYLLANPEILLEVQSKLEAKMEKQQEERLKTAIKSNADELYRRADAPSAGDPKGDITVVEFFDYNCGFCKRGFSEVSKLIEKDKKVRVVFKELPILSKGSEEASRVALAAKKQGKYWEMHSALLTYRGSVDGESALKIAAKLGLDAEKLKADMDSAEVTGEIDKVRELAQKMGINGTPHFLVGDRTIAGAPENLYEQIEAHVTDLRKNGCEVC
ncbi:MAG: disulfide bond formation protein DsbA [Alphaproteobacteria bacterium BRH_c36]|nr:MAG: disulfide bond formation protein DsbA [Alphaproteobacteria bacterium BRH_c36]